MANIPANIGPTLDAAFGQALTTAGGWTNAGGNIGFSLSSLLNSIGGAVINVTQTPSIVQNTAGLPVGLLGNASATGGVAAVIDNATTQTGGKIVSIRTGGVEQAYIDYVGDFSTSGYVQATTLQSTYANVSGNVSTPVIYGSSTTLTLNGQATVAGPGVTLKNQTTLTSGNIAQFVNGSTTEMAVAYNGHLIPSTVAPTVGSFNTGFGTVTGNAITGGDMAGIISFTTGTASAITANQALCTVTLATTYSSTAYAVMVANATASGALDASDYYGVPATANTFIIYNTSAITPSSTTLYKLQFMTMGAGATS